MEAADQNPNSLKQDQSSQESTRPAEITSLCARIWEYPNPQQRLRDMDWSADDSVAELVRGIMGESRGRICELHGNTLVAEFDNAFNALSAAKALQIRMLTLQRGPAAAQIVAGIIVHGSAAQAPGTDRPVLHEFNSAQILVSEAIYESARTVLGFQFNPKAARPGAPGAEAFYELLWTDESTYSHVRKTGQTSSVPTTANESRYQIQSELGRGAMGIVYKAHDQVIGRTVALKTISVKGDFAEAEELVERLKMEAKAAGGLDHPNIITIYDIGQQDGFVYLSMQFVEGKTLADVIDEGKFPSLVTLFSYADQMCSALGFAHQRGVIHRDIKPANFMLSSDGTIKILDFGIAKLGDATMTQTGVVVGTPTYMAPEQATGKKLDQRSDIFALGTVLYELFTRERAFKGDVPTALYKVVHEEPTPPSIINPSLPPGFDAILHKALAKDPKDRYQTCEELKDALSEQAALLKAAADANSSGAIPRAPAVVQPRPASSGHYLLTEVRQRRSRPSIGFLITAVILLAGVAVEVWSLRVKSKTGDLPPQVSKILGRVQQKVAVASKSVESRINADHPPTAAVASPAAETPKPADNPAVPSDVTKTAAQPLASPAPTEPSPASYADDKTADVQATAAPISAAPATSVATGASASSASGQPPSSAPATTEAPSTKDQEKTESASPESATATQPPKHPAAKGPFDEANVDGFTRSEIPDLLRRADAAAGAGDYSQARYEYGIILRLDHKNAAARSGLARVIAAKAESSQR